MAEQVEGLDLAKLQRFLVAPDPWHCLHPLSSFLEGKRDT